MATKTTERQPLFFDKTAFVLSCGSEVANNKRRPKVWRLGKDERAAQQRAIFIRMAWSGQVEASRDAGLSRGEIVWTEPYLRQVESFSEVGQGLVRKALRVVEHYNSSVSNPHHSNADAPEPKPTTATLSEVVELFKAKLWADVSSNDRKPANASRMVSSMKANLKWISEKPLTLTSAKGLPDVSPVAAKAMRKIGYAEITSLASNMKNRVLSGFAPDTIKTNLSHFGAFLDWAEDAGYWQAVCNHRRLLKVNTTKLLTLAEQTQKAAGKDLFTVDEIGTLLVSATEQQRLFILLAMNCCLTQQGISDLLPINFNLDKERPHVDFIRGKSRTANAGHGITGSFDLWPEVMPLLRDRIKNRATPANKTAKDYALLTADGFQLVRYDAGKDFTEKVDSIRLSFEDLLKTCGADRHAEDQEAAEGKVRWLPFGTFRKTVSSFIRGLAGETIQQLALTHGGTLATVASRHYTGEVPPELREIEQQQAKKLADTLKRIHDEVLAPAFKRMAAAK